MSMVLHQAEFLLDPDHESSRTWSGLSSCGHNRLKGSASSHAQTRFTSSCLQQSRIWWVLITELPP